MKSKWFRGDSEIARTFRKIGALADRLASTHVVLI